MRLGFIVQRYGLEIAGGAEYHCRLVAEHLARHAEVEIFTTCASDYISWADHYAPGRELVGNLPVRRFRVKKARDTRRFAAWTARVFDEPHSERDERRWLEEQGPYAPKLVRQLRRERASFDWFIFFSYRYYPTYHGLWAVQDKAVLVPTAENDGVYGLSLFPPLLRAPRAIVYNSPEERSLIQGVAQNQQVPGDVVGVGVSAPAACDGEGFRRRHGIEGPFILFIGRVDRNKGCHQLFDFFERYRAAKASPLSLVLIGKEVMTVPQDPAIRSLGFLPEQEKWDALAAADALVMPSPYESLSMVTLEAWWAGRPVLVNGKCEVLRGQCLRSQGGLYYAGADEFIEALDYLISRPELRQRLGENGRRYVAANYAWEVIEEKYLRLLASLAGQGSTP